jgi:hypothetical protein
MSITVQIVDQSVGAAPVNQPAMSFPIERITARELVRRRVESEVACFNAEQPEVFTGLIQPESDEVMLNGSRSRPRRVINAERQVEIALDALKRHRIIMIVNGRQVEDIDAPLLLTPISEARFLRLVHLVGG